MKRFILILAFTPLMGFSQTIVNNDSLLYYFEYISNNYRKSHGLNPLGVDGTLKGFTDNWSKQMSLNGVVGHGSGDNGFQRRIETCGCFPPATFCAENCTEVYSPDVNTNLDVYCPIDNIRPYVKKAFSGKITQYELAYLAFLNFYNSPPHRATLLNKDTKYFYVSSTRGRGMTYICYISRS
jgi:uncharacterized protein YkwD